jgi:hypothetical protein
MPFRIPDELVSTALTQVKDVAVMALGRLRPLGVRRRYGRGGGHRR